LEQIEFFRSSCPPLPATLAGRGIVTSCGADRPSYLLNAYVQFRLIRYLGCDLPIECWYAGAAEKSERFAELVKPLGVTCRDAVAAGYIGHPLVKAVRFRGNLYDQAQLHGYSLKPFAMLASGFAEFVWLDADCHPIQSPAAGFDQPEYHSTGALVWEDDPHATYHFPQLKPFGISAPAGQQNGWETGQMVIDKRRHWRGLQLANWFCANADHWFQFVFGDKDAFFAAWLKEGQPYWHGKPHTHDSRCFIHSLPDGSAFVLHRAGVYAKLRLAAAAADPITRLPHKMIVAGAIEEFVRWYAKRH
jgi:alpha 1,2-mannosyltransferase